MVFGGVVSIFNGESGKKFFNNASEVSRRKADDKSKFWRKMVLGVL